MCLMGSVMAPLSGVLPTPTLFSFMLTNGPTTSELFEPYGLGGLDG